MAGALGVGDHLARAPLQQLLLGVERRLVDAPPGVVRLPAAVRPTGIGREIGVHLGADVGVVERDAQRLRGDHRYQRALPGPDVGATRDRLQRAVQVDDDLAGGRVGARAVAARVRRDANAVVDARPHLAGPRLVPRAPPGDALGHLLQTIPDAGVAE